MCVFDNQGSIVGSEHPVIKSRESTDIERPILWLPSDLFHTIAQAYVEQVETVLDIGCGILPQLFVHPRVHICLEPYAPYLVALKEKTAGITDRSWVLLNATWAEAVKLFPEQSVDTVFLVDVIEHLSKDEGAALLRVTETIARRQVLIFTPLGYLPQTHPDGKDAWGFNGGSWQEHKSGWAPDDFDDSWEIFAAREYHTHDNLGKKFDRPYGAFWAIKRIRSLNHQVDAVAGAGSPVSAEVLIQEGEQLLVEGKEPDRAARLFVQALVCDPGSANAFGDLGVAFWQMNRSEPALNCFRAAMSLAPESDIHRENYASALTEATTAAWQNAYAQGYNSCMGDHRSYFYNSALQRIGYYDLLASATRIVEFGPGNGDFLRPVIAAHPEKEFYFIEVAGANAKALETKFSGMRNVAVLLSRGQPTGLTNIESAFSFLLCQSMPATLWREHLAEVRKMLRSGGTYIFQFAYHPSGEANDSPAAAIAGSQVHSAERMTTLVREAGFQSIRMEGPIALEPFHTDIVWYICRAQS
jgi:hypothetical protein